MATSSGKIRACVVGATGYAGAELVRLLVDHPDFQLVMATDRKQAGTRLAEIYPALEGVTDIELVLPDAQQISQVADVAFLAVPHTASLAITPALLAAGVSVIDLSADYRIKDPAVYEAWYDTPHTSPDLLTEAVYGLPEINRAQLQALAPRRAAGAPALVAAPGCYPTATTLAAAPALEAGIVTSSLVISDAISGVSGAGRTPSARTHYCHANESVEAYGVAKHRHTPEIEQTLSILAGTPVDVVFTPHLAPLTRGLLATVYLQVADDVTAQQIQDVYQDFYAGQKLVTMLPAGKMPQTGSVAGSGRAQVGVALDARNRHMVIASCAIDNLGKGAAAQAIQAANIVFGLEETAGLSFTAPVV